MLYISYNADIGSRIYVSPLPVSYITSERMSKTKSTKHDAFLSFAEPDSRLVEAVVKVFDVVGAKVWFAKKDLPKTGTIEWRQAIRQAIAKSKTLFR